MTQFRGKSTAGHPVDVASGLVSSSCRDIHLDGAVSLTIDRVYSTGMASDRTPPFGVDWSCRYFATLSITDPAARFIVDDRVEEFPDALDALAAGRVIRNLGSFAEIARRGNQCVVTLWDVDTEEVSRYVFDRRAASGSWDLSAIENGSGHRLDVLHDALGRVTAVRQHLENRRLHFAYGPAGELVTVSVEARGRRQVFASYEYDQQQRLVAAFDVAGRAARYAYDGQSRLVREITRDGEVYSFTYDSAGRCVRSSGRDSYDLKTFRFLDSVNTTEVADSHGSVRRYRWLDTGQVVEEIGPLGVRLETSYDEHGRIVARTTAGGATTLYEYDDRGNRCAVIDPLGNQFSQSFNDAHAWVSLVDPLGNRWQREFDARGLLETATDPLGAQWRLAHDHAGNLRAIESPTGQVMRHDFNENNELIRTVDWSGHETHFGYDDFGRVVRVTDPDGQVCIYEYDGHGRVNVVLLPDGRRRTMGYDEAGNLSRLVNFEGGEHRYRYGSCGRLLEVIDPLGNVVRFVWDTEPRLLLRVVNADHRVYEYLYDAEGRLSAEIGFDGAEIRYEYDADSACARVRYADGEAISYERDRAGKVTGYLLSDGSEVRYDYDACGNVIGGDAGAHAVRREYDAAGRLIREKAGDFSVQWAYDASGNLTRLDDSTELKARFGYDDDGSLASLMVNDHFALRLARSALGEEVGRVLPGGHVLRQSFDTVGLLAAQDVVREVPAGAASPAGASAGPVSRRYTRNVNAAVEGIHDARSGRFRYRYDGSGNLIEAEWRDKGIERYAYDQTGNIIEKEVSPSARLTYEYDEGGRLIGDGVTSFAYDGRGRLREKKVAAKNNSVETWRYTWNVLNQLVSVTTPDQHVWSYAYDAFGRRIEKRGPGLAVQYHWNMDTVLHEVRSVGSGSTWLSAPDALTPMCTLQNGEFYSVIGDHLGTPKELLDPQGRVAWSATQLAWRVDGADTMAARCDIRFEGQWYDPESDLCYSRFRYYDPETARFISPDPTGLKGGLNLYRYAPNPMQWTDPFGLVNIGAGNEGSVTVHAYPGPPAGGIEHLPLHAHLYDGKHETRVLMQDYYKKGKLVGRAGDVYPGDRAMTKAMRKAVSKNLAHYARQTNCVFNTGQPCP